MNIESRIIATPQGLERLRTPWRALWMRAPAATAFQSPDWLIPWWRHFGPGQLRCLALSDGEDLVGFAPLYQEEGSGRLLPLGISLSDCLDVLIANERADAVRRAMQAEIARASGCREICFPDVAPNASMLTLAVKGFCLDKNAGQLSPELALGPTGNPLKNVPAHQRQNLRTAENRARRRGCIVSDVAARQLPQFIPALTQLHSARQEQLGHAGLGKDTRVLPFFVEAFGSLAREGVVRAYSVECGGRLIGGYIGFIHRERASCYFGGFDPAFSFESPGTILIGHAMRCAALEGARTFDFLRGAEPYKYAWGARDRQLLSLSFVRQFSDAQLAS
jgi:CelD/BcsL family acetyltransferase involved in cellulose biosynthesis